MPYKPLDPLAYLDGLDKRTERPASTGTTDPLADAISDYRAMQQGKRVVADVWSSPPPDTVAKVQRTARKLGVSPLLIENDLEGAEQSFNLSALTETMRQFPVFGKFFGDNPRAAVMAQDDAKSLGAFGRLWSDTAGLRKMGAAVGDTLGKVPAAGKASGYSFGAANSRLTEGLAEIATDVDVFFKTVATPGRYTNADIDKIKADSRAYWAGPTRQFQEGAARVRPQYSGIVQEGLLGGIENLGTSALAMGATVATRNPNAGYFVMGATSGLPAYSDARKAGLSPAESLVYSVEQGGTEILTEKIPANRLLEALAKKTPVGKMLMEQLATEIPGEQIATVVQDLSQWVHLNPDKTVGEYLAERPDAAIKTLLGTISGTTVQTGAIAGTTRVVEKVVEARRAKEDAALLEKHGKVAEGANLRTRDPETFRELMKATLDERGTEHVYLPGEAAVAYFQSDAYDPDSDPMAEFYHEAFDAAASGGDVVLPADFALSVLPGTPAWEAVRGDLRLTSGGMSANEADSLDIDAMMAEVDDRFNKIEAAQREANDARATLTEKITAKLNNAGYTPYMARAQAELIAQRTATRAARRGEALTGNEFDTVEVNQVLPPELARAKAADGTDLVINALRKGKDAEVYDGPTLLEWIAKRGGINDTGGDLKSMGLDKWHLRDTPIKRKDKKGRMRTHSTIPGRKKLLRDFDPSQGAFGGVSGAGDYGVDSTLRAAIEAGYFPDLVGVEGESGPSSLDTQALLDAMADENAGRPRYAGEARVDPMRAAAEELRGLLADRGLDPDGMSDAELRSVIGQLDAASAGGYEQSYGDGPRGRIQFNTGRTVIDLFQARNNSTLIHELSHMWLEELRIDAELPDAPEQLKQDWQTVQDWFAANNQPVTDGIIPVEAHELFARAGERYVMEGKAPSPALTRLFETFRGWMVSIYKTVTALRAPITPEIRGVFDRLVATDEELNAMAERQMLEPLFKDAASIGMSEQEFKAYSAEVEAARAEASSGLLEKTMASVRGRVTKEWNEQKRRLAAEASDELDQRPLYRAIKAMRETPVNAQWIRDEIGADALDLMPRSNRRLYSDKGAHPDAIAEIAGYGSGREMIEALIGAEIQHRQAREGGDQRTMRERTIAQNVDEEMRRRHGDPFTDGSIEREALEAVHNEKQGEVFAAEARALARKTGQRVTPYKVAREWARRRVRQGTYAAEASPAAIQRHARNAAKAGTAAEKALLAGKFDEALLAKQQQMLASAQLSEAKQANDEAEAARKRMDKIARRATSKSVDQDYLDQAHALLEAVDLRERSQKLLNRAGSWEEWSNARAAEGFDIVVPPSFEALIGKTNWSRLPVEQLLGLDAAVAQVMHLGRLKQTLLDNQERRDFEELVQEARAGAGNIDGPPPQDLMEPGWFDAIKAKVAATDAALLKMETIFDWLDGGNPNGVFNRIAFRPIADAQGREQDMLVDYYGRIKALFEAVPGEITARWGDTVTLPFTNRETGRPERVRRQQLLAIALNTGNEGNLQRLTDGYGWNADALREVLNTELTADEWVMVQGVWDVIETLWPEIEGMEKRVNGLAPEKVEAREIVTPHGTFRGGYYPAIYDSTRNYRAEENRGKESDLFEGGYTRATTRASATKNRLDKVTAPILLDLGVINRHLGEVIHDITHREAVMQANKFLTNERIMRVVDEALGPEIRKQFRPWVKFVANSWAIERAGNEGFGKWLGKLRANVTAVGMGLRATTMVTQIAGYSNSVEVVGEKWVAEAIARTTAHPVASFNFVLEKSPEVRNRMDTLDRDIRTELARLSAANPASKAARMVLDGRKFFFHGIGYMDRVVVVPTWIAAYNKAQSEGMAESEAIYAADKAVRVSQGAGAPKDMAAIVRGTGKWGEALKLMTMFYSYFSAMYQRERTLGRDVVGSDQRRPRNVPRLAARAFWLMIVPPLLTEVLKAGLGGGDAPDDEEWWAQWVMRKMLANALGPIPMARDVFEPAWNAARGGQAFTPAFSPVNRALSSFVDAARDVGKIARGEETTKATKHILETTGYATGLVPGQVASAAQFMVDVGAGDADPEGFADWVQGLSTGKIKDD